MDDEPSSRQPAAVLVIIGFGDKAADASVPEVLPNFRHEERAQSD